MNNIIQKRYNRKAWLDIITDKRCNQARVKVGMKFKNMPNTFLPPVSFQQNISLSL